MCSAGLIFPSEATSATPQARPANGAAPPARGSRPCSATPHGAAHASTSGPQVAKSPTRQAAWGAGAVPAPPKLSPRHGAAAAYAAAAAEYGDSYGAPVCPPKPVQRPSTAGNATVRPTSAGYARSEPGGPVGGGTSAGAGASANGAGPFTLRQQQQQPPQQPQQQPQQQQQQQQARSGAPSGSGSVGGAMPSGTGYTGTAFIQPAVGAPYQQAHQTAHAAAASHAHKQLYTQQLKPPQPPPPPGMHHYAPPAAPPAPHLVPPSAYASGGPCNGRASSAGPQRMGGAYERPSTANPLTNGPCAAAKAMSPAAACFGAGAGDGGAPPAGARPATVSSARDLQQQAAQAVGREMAAMAAANGWAVPNGERLGAAVPSRSESAHAIHSPPSQSAHPMSQRAQSGAGAASAVSAPPAVTRAASDGVHICTGYLTAGIAPPKPPSDSTTLVGGAARVPTGHPPNGLAAAVAVPHTTIQRPSSAMPERVASQPPLPQPPPGAGDAGASAFRESAGGGAVMPAPGSAAYMEQLGLGPSSGHPKEDDEVIRQHLLALTLRACKAGGTGVGEGIGMPVGLSELYKLGKAIGEGAFGFVRVAQQRLSRELIAVKTFEKVRLRDSSSRRRLENEIRVLQRIRHPYIVRLYEVFESPKRIHLCMEHVSHGTLHRHLTLHKRLPENEVRRLVRQLVGALAYLHQRAIAHRDIKLENVLLDEKCDVRLIDFGFAILSRGKLRVPCGSPAYTAPEILLAHEYDGHQADVWSLGILIYVMLAGRFPFQGATRAELSRNVLRGTFTSPSGLSREPESLLRRVLVLDPNQRYTIEHVRVHPWMQVRHASNPGQQVRTPPLSAHLNLIWQSHVPNEVSDGHPECPSEWSL
jgi:hypothetical protein